MPNGRQKECPILECTLYGIPINKSLTTDSTKDICEHSSKGCEESKHKAPEKAEKDVKNEPTGIPSGLKRKLDAVKQKLEDHHTAFGLLSTSARTEQIAPLLASATLTQIDTTSATTAEAIAAVEVLMGASNAAELAEQGLKEAEEANKEVVKNKIITRTLART